MNPTSLFVEPLEPRVAPAILVNGGNLLGGAGNPTTGETSTGGNTVTLIKVLSGQALVFYDSTHTNITGISVGKHTRLDITGDVTGDIVTNLLPSGRLTDSDNNPANGQDGGILMPYSIKGITTHPLANETGSLGRIIAGGAVNNVNVSGSLSGIYAGNGIFRDGDSATVSTGTVDYNAISPGLQNAITLTRANAKSSSDASINNVVVAVADQLEVFSGGGSNNTTTTGGIGGSITNVTITTTLAGQGNNPALYLHAGDGGSGTNGGEGGAITHFNDQDSIAYVKVQTGDGGAASNGNGGAGGSLETSTIVTSSPRYDLLMGHGGTGDAGGKGGSISALSFTNNVNGGASLIATGDYNNDGIQDVLLVNTVTGTATLSLGTGNTATPYTVALQTLTNPDGTVGNTPFIAAEGAVPTGVVAADLNGDGNLDFVVSYASTDNLGVFLGHGNGTFTASSVALSVRPNHIVAGDFSGTAATDIAVLSSGNTASLNSTQNSEVLIVQNDGTGVLTPLTGPATISGVGTALVAAQIDGVGKADLFVGLQSGGVAPLFDTGAAFNVGATITAFNTMYPAPVDGLDVSTASGGTLLLAFSKNINVNNPTDTDVTPQVDLISVATNGTANGTQIFTPNLDAKTAHFVTGTDTVGVAGTSAVTLFSNAEGTYTALSSLGSSGVLSDFAGTVVGGQYSIVAIGAATNRFFFTSGDPFSAAGLPAFQHFNIPYEDRTISFTAGDGGDAGTHVGGTGGSIKGLTYTQTLGGGVIEAGGTYNTYVTTGDGGTSTGGAGGNGGALNKVTLSLMPGDENLSQDDTTFAFLRTGVGGAGTSGGAGGSISKTVSNSVFTDFVNNQLDPQAVAIQLEAGNGGVGTVKAGGAGGSITLDGPSSLNGVTFYDYDFAAATPEAPGLLVEGGNGGDGVTAGGAGGSLTNVGAQNAVSGGFVIEYNELASADIAAGHGGNASQGNGGAGGNISGLNIGVQSHVDRINPLVSYDGWMTVTGGAGGDSSGGQGGSGGGVIKATVASAQADPNLHFGVLIDGGAGGGGTSGGGTGGGVKTLIINTSANTNAYSAVIAAGNGGDATVSGAGGNGGLIKGITESKDVDSTISAILGGSGGTSASGAGGTGGSVKNIDTVGFIGLPANDTTYLGVFDPALQSATVATLFAGGNISQGIFAGRGADGSASGSVHNVVAQQIAAIGAVVDENGLFGVASAVTKVTADLIGYDTGTAVGFNSADGGTASPGTARPADGFILAATVSGVTTEDPSRTAAYTFNG